MFILPSSPVDDMTTPNVAVIKSTSSAPYIFLRPYLSARNPNMTIPSRVPANVAILMQVRRIEETSSLQ